MPLQPSCDQAALRPPAGAASARAPPRQPSAPHVRAAASGAPSPVLAHTPPSLPSAPRTMSQPRVVAVTPGGQAEAFEAGAEVSSWKGRSAPL